MKKALGRMLAATLALGAMSAQADGAKLPGPIVKALLGPRGFDDTALNYIMPVYHANLVHSAMMGGTCQAPVGATDVTIARSIYDQLAFQAKDIANDQAALRIMMASCVLWPPKNEPASQS